MAQIKFIIKCPQEKPITIIVPGALADIISPGRPTTGDVDVTIPRVEKLMLTDESELEIFGSIHVWKSAAMPGLPWGEQDERSALAEIDDDCCIIYNNRTKSQIKPGKVWITQSKSIYGVRLNNATDLEFWLTYSDFVGSNTYAMSDPTSFRNEIEAIVTGKRSSVGFDSDFIKRMMRAVSFGGLSHAVKTFNSENYYNEHLLLHNENDLSL